MAYTPKDWVTGEVITEQALDHIEQGIAGMIIVIPFDPLTPEPLSYTWQELHDAMANGSVLQAVVTFNDNVTVKQIGFARINQGKYQLCYADDPSGTNGYFEASSADDYPVFTTGSPQ